MNVDDWMGQSGEWLKGTGTESDVVISSRVRIARNLKRFPFLTTASARVRSEIESHLQEKLERTELPGPLHYFPLATLKEVDRNFLFERHLISREMVAGNGARGAAIGKDEAVSIMVNEEDHLRFQVIRSGLELQEAYELLDSYDSRLEENLSYAYHTRFGYLTACPTNVGTGLRLSVMMHLPASVLSKQMDKVLQSLQRLNYTIRGFYGEGTQPIGDFYQISNQVTLGKSEADLIDEMRRVVPEVLKFERSWRYKLMEDEPKKIEDKVWRGFGLLKHARRISSEETIVLLSALRLGANLNILRKLPIKVINRLCVCTQPSHLQKLSGRVLDHSERDVVRAEYIRGELEKF